MAKKNLFFKLLFILLGFSTHGQTVSTVTALQNALSAAGPGTTITIANGTYTNADLSIEATGTASNPIIIKAETPGSVIFSNNSRIKMGGDYITLTGVKFTGTYSLSTNGSNSYVISLKNTTECSNCTVTQVQIDGYNPSSTTFDFRWVRMYGQDNELSYCTFNNKTSIGSMLFNQRSDGNEDRHKIHHNYFANRVQVGTADQYNDLDVMRIGDSGESLTTSSTEVYDNYFYKANGGEPEIISNKSSGNKYYNNTFEDYLGALSLRHGNNCEVYNNFFLNKGQTQSYFNGGIRVEGENHKVYNNYIQGTNSTKQGSSSTAGSLGGINVSAGQSASNFVLNGYGQVKNAMIVNNTFVDCDYGLRIGADSGGTNQNVAPTTSTFANNLFVNCSNNLANDRAATSSTFAGNMYSGGTVDSSTGFSSQSGLLSTTKAAAGYYPIVSTSPAVNASSGTHGQSNFTTDLFAGTRIGTYDVGAQEYGATIVKGPYRQSDVGVTVGFGANVVVADFLNTSVSSLAAAKSGSTLTFDITSNVSWTVSDNSNWISVSPTSGSNNGTVTVTVNAYTGTVARTGTVTITDGTITKTVAISQTGDDYVITEIPIVAATGVGTEVGKEATVATEFAWDNDVVVTKYWSANSNSGEASITFDLTCNHQLNSIGINLLKADERTTNFSVSVARSESSSSFVTVISNQNSAIGTFDVEQSFNFPAGTIGRYVKFTGNSNSVGSGWISLSEASIYGNTACTSALGNAAFESLDGKGISIFPVPVTNGVLNIVSETYEINAIEVINLNGQKVIVTDAKGANSTVINTSSLPSGTYFITLEGLGTTKFIVK
jgi:poly(beta-D-mannuronate) lyase